ncbi:hypothetical protein ES708_08227 [subsurface metagenome]
MVDGHRPQNWCDCGSPVVGRLFYVVRNRESGSPSPDFSYALDKKPFSMV